MLLALLHIGLVRHTVMSMFFSTQLAFPDRDSPSVVVPFRLIDAEKRASCSCVRPDPSNQPPHGPKPRRMVSFASPSSNTRSEVMIFVICDSRSTRPPAPDTACGIQLHCQLSCQKLQRSSRLRPNHGDARTCVALGFLCVRLRSQGGLALRTRADVVPAFAGQQGEDRTREKTPTPAIHTERGTKRGCR